MAVVTTTIVPALTIFPWTDLEGTKPDNIQPIGELMANTRDGAITLSGTGDTQEARWVVTLPPNYSYVLQDYSASINISAANTWEDLQTLIFQDTGGAAGTQTFEWGINLKSEGVTRGPSTVIQIQTYRPLAYPKFQMRGGGVLQSTFVDLTTEEGAANLNATARFLIYTIAQQFDTSVNTPLLVR